MTERIIEAKNIHKTYDTGNVMVEALKGINLRIEKGEMVGIMGPSGCGKTTMLNVLSGLDDASEGDVQIEGRSLFNLTDDEKTLLRSQRMGFIFQFFNLLPVLTSSENVELPLLVAGVKPKEARRRAQEMLELVGLGDKGDSKPSELSGGQQQRVTIARSLVNNPAIIWADEPTGNLDSERSSEIIDLLVELNKKNGQTFIIVTHDPKVGQRMDRIIWMESGKIVDDGRSSTSDRLKKNLACLIEQNKDGVVQTSDAPGTESEAVSAGREGDQESQEPLPGATAG
jgi:putative ABC transport system ATP-binding protein